MNNIEIECTHEYDISRNGILSSDEINNFIAEFIFEMLFNHTHLTKSWCSHSSLKVRKLQNHWRSTIGLIRAYSVWVTLYCYAYRWKFFLLLFLSLLLFLFWNFNNNIIKWKWLGTYSQSSNYEILNLEKKIAFYF